MNDYQIKYHLEESDGAGPDARLRGVGSDGTVIASAGLWWRRTPEDPERGTRLGCVGEFECADIDAGVALLEYARAKLKDCGCARVAGPMDGDTWHKYRLVTAGRDDVPPFLLEPWNPPEYVEAFERAGFLAWAHYSSSILPLDEPDERAATRHARLVTRMASRGVVIRSLDLDDFEGELGSLYDLSRAAFADNFLYTPIEREVFLEMYRPVKAHVREDFVLFAEKDGRAVGFVFALPDLLLPEARRIIVKTLAVDPKFRQLGLGTILVDKVQAAARADGFRESIHALQYEDNSSTKITQRSAGRKFRDYTLYQRLCEQL